MMLYPLVEADDFFYFFVEIVFNLTVEISNHRKLCVLQDSNLPHLHQIHLSFFISPMNYKININTIYLYQISRY